MERRVNLHNGIASFTFGAMKHAEVGDKFSFDIGFEDNGPRGLPLTFKICIKITKPEPKSKKPSGRSKDTQNKLQNNIADPIEWITKENWGNEFDEKTGSIVSPDEQEGTKIRVNRDHEELANMSVKEADEAVRKLNEKRFRIFIGCLSLAIYNRYRDEDEETAVENSKIASSAIAPFALPMLKLLHEIDK